MNSKQNQIEKDKSNQEHFSLLDSLPEVWAKRIPVALFVAAATVLSIVYVLLAPSMYMAETSILPELDKNKLLGVAGMADLASVTGLAVGDAPVSKLYPMIIKSNRILGQVISTQYRVSARRDSIDLIRLWEIEGRTEEEKLEYALRRLRRRTSVVFVNRLGTLVLTVEMEEPALAAAVANRITKELDLYTRTKRKTSVTAQREFIEQRLQEVDQALRNAENALRSFREKNRRVMDSPQLLLEQGRLERDLQINSTIFIELKKQVEIAKIEEIKNIPLINVLDEASEPFERSWPKRTQFVTLTFLLSLLLATGVALAKTMPAVKHLRRRVAEIRWN
jgi:uncharacterized protein involved in exopolysaccharide biosynthesis